MTSRKEDELDLGAMEIAEKIKPSSNVRIPSDAHTALAILKTIQEVKERDKRKDGAA